MKIADKLLSIDDFRRLGALKIYSPTALVAFTQSHEVDPDAQGDPVPGARSFRIEELFSARTKFLRQLWLARQPGVLPMEMMQRFALLVAQEVVKRLAFEGTLSDIRLTAALAAQAQYLAGTNNARSVEPLRAAVRQAVLDHSLHASDRAAAGCSSVYDALDPDGYEAGAGAAFHYLELFPGGGADDWLRAHLLTLIRAA
jgi:hypothetical protein